MYEIQRLTETAVFLKPVLVPSHSKFR